MKLNQFAVYRVDQQTAGKALWHLPYQEAIQQNVSIIVENYRLISIHEFLHPGQFFVNLPNEFDGRLPEHIFHYFPSV